MITPQQDNPLLQGLIRFSSGLKHSNPSVAGVFLTLDDALKDFGLTCLVCLQVELPDQLVIAHVSCPPGSPFDSFKGQAFLLEHHALTSPLLAERQGLYLPAGPDPQKKALPDILAPLLEEPAALCLPLVGLGSLAGILIVVGKELSAGELPVAEALASQLALGLENARLHRAKHASGAAGEGVEHSEWAELEQALPRRTDELKMLHALTLDITSSLDLNVLLQTIIESATTLLKGTSGILYFCDSAAEQVTVMLCYKTKQDYTGKTLNYGEGAAGVVAQRGEPLIIDDYRFWDNRITPEGEADPRETIIVTVPMKWQGQTIGILQVMDEIEPRIFTPDDQELLMLLADQAAIAIENARLLVGERTEKARAEALQDVARLVSASLNIDDVIRLILGRLHGLLAFDQATVVLMAENGTIELAVGISREGDELDAAQSGQWFYESPLAHDLAHSLAPWMTGSLPAQAGWPELWVPDMQSLMAAPIVARQQVIGSLLVCSSQAAAFTPADLKMLEALAQQMAIAIENARLFEAERAQLLLAQTLKDMGTLLTSELSLEQVLENILNLVGRVIQYDSISIHMVEEGRMVMRAGRGFRNYEQTCEEVYSIGETLLERWKDQKEIFIISDTAEDDRWVRTSSSAHVRSWMGVPLIVKNRTIGTLNFDSTIPQAYNPSLSETVKAFANQAAIAIENARLFEALDRRASELETLRQAGLTLTSSLELAAVLDAIMDSTFKMLPKTEAAYIFLYHHQTDTLTFGSSLWADGRRRVMVNLPRPNGITATVARTGEMIVIPDINRDAQFSGLDWNGGVIGLPLKIGPRVVGVMNVTLGVTHAVPEADLHMLRLLGDHAALAIENAHLFERAAAERSHWLSLYDIGQELVTSLDADTILGRALQLTCQALGGKMGVALLYRSEGRRFSIRSVHGRTIEDLDNLNDDLNLFYGYGMAGWVAQVGQPVYSRDLRTSEHWVPVPGLDEDMLSCLAAPIMEESRLLGVLLVLHSQTDAFAEDHLDLLQTISQQVALALSNAERYQQIQNLVDLLAAEQYRLEGLVERLPVGVLLLDERHRMLVANPLGREILETLNKRALGNRINRLGPLSLADLIARRNDPLPTEIVTESPHAIYEAQACELGGDVHQWVLVLRDVTRERENQMRVQMQERLATVGQLAAGIAHDFNNIMAAILVYSDLLMRDLQPMPNSRERLMVIQQQIQRASSLIRQILDFSRRSVMEQSPLDLLPFMKELEKLLRRLLPENIQIDLINHTENCMVNADPTRLQQILMNLALNARDAMPQGGRLSFKLARVKLKPSDPPPVADLTPGDWIHLEVSDTGEGIPPSIRPHIFEPFFTTKGVGKGTGLGLAQVYGIVKQHNGLIEVFSEVDSGTTFSIYLPALSKESSDESVQDVPVQFDGHGKTILLVEDDDATRNALQDLLCSQDYAVLNAENGKAALQVFAKRYPEIDLVVSDVVMPAMGGLALYEALAQQWPGVKMMFISGHPMDQENQWFLDSHHVRWLQKPFSVKEFSTIIAQMCQEE